MTPVVSKGDRQCLLKLNFVEGIRLPVNFITHPLRLVHLQDILLVVTNRVDNGHTHTHVSHSGT